MGQIANNNKSVSKILILTNNLLLKSIKLSGQVIVDASHIVEYGQLAVRGWVLMDSRHSPLTVLPKPH